MSTTFKQLMTKENGHRQPGSERLAFAVGYLAAQEGVSLGLTLVSFRRKVWIVVFDGYLAGELDKSQENDS